MWLPQIASARWIAAVAALALAPACSGGPTKVDLGPPSGRVTHEDYDDLRDRWTRGTKIIRELDTTLHLHATLFSPEFSAAYVARQAHTFKLTAEKRAALAARLKKEWAESYPFFVAAATMKHEWNDFDRDKSVWSVSLINDKGEQVAPVEVKAERKINPTIVDLFPYVGRFHRVYWIRFPKALPTGARSSAPRPGGSPFAAPDRWGAHCSPGRSGEPAAGQARALGGPAGIAAPGGVLRQQGPAEPADR